MDIALWVLAVILIVVGIAGTILPALPGIILVLAGFVLGAWLADCSQVSGAAVGVIAVLALIGWLVDYFSGVLGAKRAGASKEAIIGGLIGTVVGVFTGLWGLIFMPFLGAGIGQYIVDRDMIRARNVGFATWLGMAVGTVAKVAIAFLMIGIFIAALLIP